MKTFLFIPIIRLLFLFSLLTAQAQSIMRLTDIQKRKIDAAFGSLLNKQYPELNMPRARTVSIEPLIENNTAYYDALIYTDSPEILRRMGVKTGASVRISSTTSVVTAKISLAQIVELAQASQIMVIRAPKILKPNNKEVVGAIGADILHNGFLNNTEYRGQGVLVGILDSGLDWTHGDFRDPNDTSKSRILSMWDMTLTKQTGEQTPADRNAGYGDCCDLGVEYTQAEINNELDGTPTGFVREKDAQGHGTHVTGTAAGNGASTPDRQYAGVAPEANLIIVRGGVSGFTDANIINGLEYLKRKAQELNRPIVVNMSLGSHFSAHDHSDPDAVATDNFVGKGRVVVVAAGNEGSSFIHVRKNLTDGSSQTARFNVAPYQPGQNLQDDFVGFVFYTHGDDPVNVTMTSPSGIVFTLAAGDEKELSSQDGYIYGSNAIDPNNGDRLIHLQLFDYDPEILPAQGTWIIRFDNPQGGNDGSMDMHGWMYNSTIPATLAESDNNYTVASPGTAPNALTVGAFANKLRFSTETYESLESPGVNDDIASFSSRGPTRSELQKPDITAPGQWVASSKAKYETAPYVTPDGKHHYSLGTSMASPAVTGAVALLLQQSPSLQASEVKTLIKNNAMRDQFTGPANNNTWGAGKLDVFKAMSKLVNNNITVNREIQAYDEWNESANVALTGTQRAAVRFTPDFEGALTGIFFHTFGTAEATPLNLTGPIVVQICADNNGKPGAVLATKNYSRSMAYKYTWHFLSFADNPVPITFGKDYHVVLSLANPNDDWGLNADNVNVDLRSHVLINGNWVLQNTFDFRIRSVVASSGSALFSSAAPSSFTAERANNLVVLKWRTQSDAHSNKFEIERRFSNEENFRKIGEINAKDRNNSKNTYQYEDQTGGTDDASPLIYYRLKSIVPGNGSTYSDIITVTNASQDLQERIYPNPATETIHVVTKDETEKKVQIIDAAGKLILEQNVSGRLGTLDIHSLPPGQYIVRVVGGPSFKLIKN